MAPTDSQLHALATEAAPMAMQNKDVPPSPTCSTRCKATIAGFLPECFRLYRSWLRKSSPVAPVSILIGILVLTAIAAGTYRGELETQLNEIWIPEDSRIQGERDFYTAHYGGDSSLELVILTDKNKVRNAVNTATHLSALEYLTRGWQDQNESYQDQIVTNAREPMFAVDTRTGVSVFRASDFCERPQVPASLAPCPDCDSSPLAYLTSSGGLPLAWGYAALSRCNWDNRASTTAQGAPGVMLPAGSPHVALGVAATWAQTGVSDWSLTRSWGIDRYPCKSASILKAFKEGNAGYPACLRILEKDRGNFAQGGFAAAVAAQLVFGTSDANYFFAPQTGCIDGSPVIGQSVKDQWVAHLTLAGKAMTASATSTVWANLLRSYTTAFYVFGYRHKTSFLALAHGSTDDGAAAIASFISTSIGNHEMDTLTCLSTKFEYAGVTRGRCPCIINEQTLPLPEELMLSTDRTVVDGATTRFGGFRLSTTVAATDAINHAARLRAKGVETTGERQKLLEKWETVLYEYLAPFWDGTDANFATGGKYQDSNVNFFMSKKSLSDQLRETGEFRNSAMLILIGLGLLLVFAVVWYHPCDTTCSEASVITVVSITCVSLGVMSGYGSLGWMGFKFSVTSPVVAVVGLGLGCNDMFVCLNCYLGGLTNGLSAHEAIRALFAHAGPSIVVTTLSNGVGFAIATVMDIPAVRQFCIQMGITCVLVLYAMLSIVMPMLVMHAQFIATDTDGAATTELDHPSAPHKAAPRKSLLGLTQLAITDWYVPCYSHTSFRAVGLLVWMLSTGLGIWGCTQLDIGLSIADVSRSGSYQHDFGRANNLFSGYTAWVVARQPTWDSAVTQQASLDQDVVLQKSRWVSDTNKLWTTSWLGNRTQSLIGFAHAQGLTEDASTANGVTGENLYAVGPSGMSLFDQWLAVSGTSYTDFLVCHTTLTSGIPCLCTDRSEPQRRIVVASHMCTLRGLKTTRDYVASIEDTRELLDDSNGDGNDAYIYGLVTLYWEQYIGIELRLITLCAVCIAGIVATNMLLEQSLTIALLMALLLTSFAVQVAAGIALLSLRLNAFSLVNVVVSIGFAVEYTVHLTHAFMRATGSRQERTQHALIQVGAATLAGAFTTFLAILPLTFSAVPLFTDYYFATFAMASLIGLFNGMVVWPIFLAIFGPESSTILRHDPEVSKLGTAVDLRDLAVA